MKRTFIAIKIYPEKEMREILDHFRKDLPGENIKWVNPDNLHITLSFLGDTDEENITIICDKIKQVAKRTPSFELLFRSTGIFKNIRDPRIIWIGTDDNATIKNIKSEIEDELEKFGFKKENRDFRPHLTIARIKWIKNRSMLEDIIHVYADREVQRSEINEIIYYESILKPEGPDYIPIIIASLGERI